MQHSTTPLHTSGMNCTHNTVVMLERLHHAQRSLDRIEADIRMHKHQYSKRRRPIFGASIWRDLQFLGWGAVLALSLVGHSYIEPIRAALNLIPSQ